MVEDRINKLKSKIQGDGNKIAKKMVRKQLGDLIKNQMDWTSGLSRSQMIENVNTIEEEKVSREEDFSFVEEDIEDLSLSTISTPADSLKSLKKKN